MGDASSSEAVEATAPFVPWGVERVGELTALLDACLPTEHFTADELETILWDDPGIVLGTASGVAASAVGAATIRRFGDVAVGYLKLIVVDPASRRRGMGRALLAAIEHWCAIEGATELHLSGTAPVYLWPGIDVHTMTPMLCLADMAGYQARTCELNMVLPTSFRATAREGIECRRIIDDVDDQRMTSLIETHWPWWLDEYRRAVEGATAIGAFEAEVPLGFVCHSVSHLGLLGPMGTDPTQQGGGVGAALVSEVGKDLMAAGLNEIEICWAGPVTFYAKLGAHVNRAFRTYRKRGLV